MAGQRYVVNNNWLVVTALTGAGQGNETQIQNQQTLNDMLIYGLKVLTITDIVKTPNGGLTPIGDGDLKYITLDMQFTDFTNNNPIQDLPLVDLCPRLNDTQDILRFNPPRKVTWEKCKLNILDAGGPSVGEAVVIEAYYCDDDSQKTPE